MPSLFDRPPVRFQYPDNWTLDVESGDQRPQTVTVSGPDGPFWSVSVHPADADLQSLAKEATEAMSEEYEEVESAAATETIGDFEAIGYDLNFYYLDLTNTAVVRCFRSPQGVYAVFYQAEDRDFERLSEVFQAITASLLMA
jgi:hypothetical protein